MRKHFYILLVVMLGLALSASAQEKSCDSIYFDDNRASLNYAALNYLNQLATAYSIDSSDIHLFAVTSESGDMSFARRLSLRRAQNVNDYLIAIGVPSNSLTIDEILPDNRLSENRLLSTISFVQINKF